MRIINPYSDVNWSSQQKANLHSHTSQTTINSVVYGSDGDFTAQQIIDGYYNNGYKILSITDHDAEYSQVTTYPWTIFERDPATLGMLAIEGKEFSEGNHINGLFCNLGYAGSNESETVIEITNHNGLGVINHPGRYSQALAWYTELFLTHKNTLIGIEVYNNGDDYPNDRKLWDLINAATIPQGKIVYGFSNDDTHIAEDFYRNYQFILSTISESSVKSALKNGHTYFSYESGGSGEAKSPRITNIVVDETTQTITLTADSGTVKWCTEYTEEVETGNIFDYSDFTKCFVRAEIINEFGITHTQPFAFVSEFSTTISEVKAWDGEAWANVEPHNYDGDEWIKVTEIRQK